MKKQIHNISKWIPRLALLAALTVSMTGCMTFRGDQLTKLNPGEKLPVPVAQKVQIELNLSCNGEPLKGDSEIKAKEWHSKVALRAAAKSGLFGDVQIAAPGTTNQPGLYVLRYNINNWGNQGLAAGSGFICGLTLFAFPGFATDHYTVEAEIIDWEGKSLWKKKYDDKMTLVIWIGFFPCLFVPPCYPTHVLDYEMSNIYQHSLQDMLADKAYIIPNMPVSATPSRKTADSL